MSIILGNYHSRSSVVRDDEAITPLAETEEIFGEIRISGVAVIYSLFLVPRVAVAVLVCLSSLITTPSSWRIVQLCGL